MKRAIWVGGFVVFLVLLWVILLQVKVLAANSSINRSAQEWRGIEKKFYEVSTNHFNIGEMERKLIALQRLATNRFLWSPVLNALQTATTDNVQLVRIQTLQTTIQHGAAKNKVASSTDKISFTLQAKDFSPPSEQKFIEALASTPYFKENLRKGDGIRLKEVGNPMLDPNSRRSFVLFTIECNYPDKERS